MPRPLFETEEDLDREAAATKALCEYLGADAIKLPMRSRADQLLHSEGKCVAIVEAKCRNVSSARYEDYMLSASKYGALYDWAEKGFDTYLLVRWTDATGFVSIPTKHTSGTGGRYDRGDLADIEPMVYIPVDSFTFIDGDRLC